MPYDYPASRTAEDDFNFYNSSARINVKCAFGGIYLRWGIFRNRLTCSLNNAALIIEGSMRLNKFLVNYRESNKDPNKEVDAILQRYILEQGVDDNGIIPIVVGNQAGVRGHLSLHKIECRTLRSQFRDKIKK